MSVIKDILSKNDDYYKLAKKILKEIGAIDFFDINELSFEDKGKLTYGADSTDKELYDLAFEKLKKYPEFDDAVLFRKSIDKVMSDAQY
ncbi:MAG: hypothetical protein K6F91_10250 [Ruminococcus sp.]|nr:hypothetical protein [Ruminococcus sp.]